MSKILTFVLDDEPIVGEFITRLFPDDEVVCFNNFPSFKAAFTPFVNLVIADVRIPGADIFETIEYIQSKNNVCYILVISAYFTEEMLIDFFKVRVDSVVKKTHEYSWYEELKSEVERLRPKVIEKARIANNGD